MYFFEHYDLQKKLPLTLTMKVPKTIQFSHPISFTLNLHYPPKWFLLFRYSKQNLYSLLLSYMHATCHIRIIFRAVLMLIISGEE